MSDDSDRKPPSEEILYQRMRGLLSHDPKIARCVLGKNYDVLEDKEKFKECFKESYTPIVWIGNLFTLASDFLYAKFNKWRMESGANPNNRDMPNILYLNHLLSGMVTSEEYFGKPSSALRVLMVLDGLYDVYDMNFMVAKYLIINSQIDSGFNFHSIRSKRKGLSKLLNFPEEVSFISVCDTDHKYEVTGKNLAEAFNLVMIYRSDPNVDAASGTSKYDPVKVNCALEDTLEALEFIKRIKITAGKAGNITFIENIRNEDIEVPSYGTVKLFKVEDKKIEIFIPKEDFTDDPSVELFTLEHIDYNLDDDTATAAVSLTYHSFDESSSVSIFAADRKGFTPNDDYDILMLLNRSAADRFKLISGYLPGARASSSFFRGMISAHYRYHSLLAPSIVDAIDDERDAKGRLLNTFVKKGEVAYKQMFESAFRSWELITGRELPEEWEDRIEEVSNFIRNSSNRFRRIVDWDTLVSRILIYNGPTELIKTALLHDSDPKQDGKVYNEKDKDRIEEVCKQIIAGLEMRYIDSIFDAYSVSKKKDKVYEVFGSGIENLKTLFPGDDYTIKLECKALAQSYIDAIVKTLTKIEEGDNPNEKFRFNKFAENSIQDSLSILKSSCSKTEKYSKNAQHTFLRTITAFLSFYEGIYECCQHNMRYEFEKSANILSPNEIEEYRWKIEETFIVGVRKEAERLNKEFGGENAIKNALTELWNFSDRNVAKTEARAKYYHAMLARAPINHVKLSKIFELDDGDINVKENGRSFDYNVLLKNDAKHIMFLWKVINFLAGNESDGMEEDYKGRDDHTSYKEHVKKVVYPQVVTFAQHHMDGDANESLIMMDSGNAFAEWHDDEVRILTEFQHKMNRAYYALPNISRIETEWWVDPFLIPCYKFDREIRTNYNRMEMKR